MVDRDSETAMVPFRNKKIRGAWFTDELYYSLFEIVAGFAESSNPTVFNQNYFFRSKERKKLIVFCKRSKKRDKK
jgi:hypothetical protein